jgi:hypothetical protein
MVNGGRNSSNCPWGGHFIYWRGRSLGGRTVVARFFLFFPVCFPSDVLLLPFSLVCFLPHRHIILNCGILFLLVYQYCVVRAFSWVTWSF